MGLMKQFLVVALFLLLSFRTAHGGTLFLEAESFYSDGGWVVDHGSFSPIAALEWRGYATVRAVEILRANTP